VPAAAPIRVGTAGWSLPRATQDRFPPGESHLLRYTRVFNAAEINSTFYRAHRASTLARWAASVPAGFRFSAKMPKAITHEHRLAGSASLVVDFLAQVAPLGEKLACLLVQLPPSLALEPAVARTFLEGLRERFGGEIVLEPRHESWFTAEADRMMKAARVARVAADPPRAKGGLQPGGWHGTAYFRLHGSPRVYFSSYEDAFLDSLATRLRSLAAAGAGCWCIFDNTAHGAAVANALALAQRLDAR
jgi:uncharacterized protein YecE (DUF72 family)